MEIVRIFDNYDAAQRARTALLAAGFSDANVRLTSQIDEAGPGESNFTVGNDPSVVGGQAYSRAFEPERQQSLFLMTVAARDPEQAGVAADICLRYGARSGDPGDFPPGAA